MPSIDNLLRDELKRVTETVQPGQLRPLRILAPGRRWRQRLLPLAAAAAVIAVAVSAVLVAGPAGLARPRRPSRRPYRGTTSRSPLSRTSSSTICR